MNAPMLIPLLSLLAGIFIAREGAHAWIGGISILAGGIIYGMILLLSKKDLTLAYRMQRLQWLWISLCFSGVGIISYDIRRPYESGGIANGEYIAIEGRIKELQNKTGGDLALVEISKLYDKKGGAIEPRNLTIQVRSDAMPAGIDDIIIFQANIERISDNEDSFRKSYSTQMANKGIYYGSSVRGEEIRKIGRSTTLHGVSRKSRDRSIEWIEKTELSQPAKNFLISILLGDRAYLNEEVRERFAFAGLSHILALSGMHVAMIAGLLLALLFPLNFAGRYKERLVIVGILLFGYAFLSGFGNSTIRSCIMYACMVTGVILERKNSGWNSLLLAVFIILLADPMAMYDSGLQLSFICVASLIFFSEPLNVIDHRLHNRLYRINEAVITTCVAVFGSWALTAYYFQSFPAAFLPANLILLPVLPIFLTISLIYFVFYSIGFSPEIFADLINRFYELLEGYAAWISEQSGGPIALEMTGWMVWVWCIGLILCAMAIKSKKKKLLFSGAVAAFAVVIFVSFSATAGNREYIIKSHGRVPAVKISNGLEEKEIRFLSGTLSEIEMDGKRAAAFDCSPEHFEISQQKSYDYLILTRSYTGRLKDLEGKLRVGEILFHSTMTKEREDELRAEADSLGVKTHSLREKSFRVEK